MGPAHSTPHPRGRVGRGFQKLVHYTHPKNSTLGARAGVYQGSRNSQPLYQPQKAALPGYGRAVVPGPFAVVWMLGLSDKSSFDRVCAGV